MHGIPGTITATDARPGALVDRIRSLENLALQHRRAFEIQGKRINDLETDKLLQEGINDDSVTLLERLVEKIETLEVAVKLGTETQKVFTMIFAAQRARIESLEGRTIGLDEYAARLTSLEATRRASSK